METTDAAVRVMTLNLWFAATDLDARLEAAAVEIVEREPDVVCLQEVLFPAGDGPDVATRLAELCGMAVAVAVPFSDLGKTPGKVGDRGGQAILTRLRVRDVGAVELPGRDLGGSTRGAVYARLATPAGRDLLTVTTHLAWGGRFEATRITQAAALDAAVNALLEDLPDDTVTVLTGDLNTGPDADTVRFLTGLTTHDGAGAYWTDAWSVAGRGDGATSGPSNPWAATTASMVGIADPSVLPDRRIDFVLVRDFVYGRPGFPRGARLAFTTPRAVPSSTRPVVASDHWGVETDLWDPPRA